MKHTFKSGLLLACFSALTACTATPSHQEWMTGDMNNSQDVLDQAEYIHSLSGQRLSVEADHLQKAYSAKHSERNRLRLALFLAMAPAPQGDRDKALALLDVPPGGINGKGRQHPLAKMILPLLLDYHRLEENRNSLQQKQHELQQSHSQLQQKLDALRNIETKIQERPTIK